MSNNEYYDLLGVDKQATPDEIKKAFRQKARQCHPDVNSAPDAEDQFKAINEAYDVLSNPQKKAQYDQFGSVGSSAGAGGPGGGYQYVDFGDIFGGGSVDLGDLFSTFMGGTRRGGRGQVRTEGRDMAMSVAVSLEDAATGITREITVDRLAPCDECDSSGSSEGSKGTVTCPECDGSGQVVSYQQTFFGTMQSAATCTRCSGTGKTISAPCPECEGSGRLIDRQQVDVTIPAGIRDGQQIRLRNMGEAGIRGASVGDLIVTVRILAHDRFERSGADLHAHLELSFTEAALGATKKIDGLIGVVECVIPAGTNSGDRIKVPGAGMPVIGKEHGGDLYFHAEVVVPKKLTSKQKELLRELSISFGDSETSVVDHHKSGFEKGFGKVKDWLNG